MPTVLKIGRSALDGGANVSTGELAKAVRALAIENAQAKLIAGNHTDITDSTGGATGSIKSLAIPGAAWDGSGSTSNAVAVTLDTNLDIVGDVCTALADTVNDLRVLVGMDAVAEGDGLKFGNVFTFVDGDVAHATTDNITEVAHGLLTEDGPYTLTTTGTLPTGLATSTNYWVMKIDADNFRLCATKALAIAGTHVAITGVTSGTHTLVGQTADTLKNIIIDAGSAAGATSAEFQTGIAKMQRVANQIATLIRASNELFEAAGISTVANNTGGRITVSSALSSIRSPLVGANAGTYSIRDTVADTFLDNCEDTLAELADKVNRLCTTDVATLAKPYVVVASGGSSM